MIKNIGIIKRHNYKYDELSIVIKKWKEKKNDFLLNILKLG
jgi:hypothetical protein